MEGKLHEKFKSDWDNYRRDRGKWGWRRQHNDVGLKPSRRSMVARKSCTRWGKRDVRTMYAAGVVAHVASEMNIYRINIIKIDDSRWTGIGITRLATGKTIVCAEEDC